MMTTLDLGFVGLGIMGAPMAGHLCAAGHTLYVYTRSKLPDALLMRVQSVALTPQRSRRRLTSSSPCCQIRQTLRKCCLAKAAPRPVCVRANQLWT